MVVTTGFPHATNTLEVGRCELYCDEVLWHQPYEYDVECQPEEPPENTGRIKPEPEPEEPTVEPEPEEPTVEPEPEEPTVEPEPEEPTVEPEAAASLCCVADSRVEPPAVCDDDDLMVLCDARVLEAVTALLGYSDSCLLDCVMWR
jgi:hypothetical protein